MKKIYIGLIAGIALIISGCEDTPAVNECAPSPGCTEIFVSLSHSPKNASDEAIILDSYYSQNLDNGRTYNFYNEDSKESGVYIIITDAQIEEIKANGTRIRFFGEKDGEEILVKDFLVGHDCCHVKLLADSN